MTTSAKRLWSLMSRLAGSRGTRRTTAESTFGQRRKTLRNALNNVVSAEQFVAAGVRPDARAEQLDVAEFIALANAS